MTGRALPRWDEVVVVVAGTSWDDRVWMSERHVAIHLAERVGVLWVDPYRSCLRGGRTAPLRSAGPGIVRVSPATVPGITRPLLRDVAIRQTRATVRRAIATLGARVRGTLVATLDDLLDVAPTGRRVFYGTDDLVAGARLTGVDPAWLQRAERRQLTRADAVVAISPVLAEKWSAGAAEVTMVPNGCDAAHFATADAAAPPSDVRLRGPLAGFVGHLSERIDLEMLEAIAAAGISLLVVGPRQPTFELARMDALFARPNVQWVGPRDFRALPSYLRVIDVGLTPYRRSEFNRASFPLKTLEYLAAGRAVVASDLPAHRWLATPHVAIARTPAEAVAHTTALLAAPRRPADVAARRAFAAEHTWAARTAQIAQVLQLDEPPLARKEAA